MKNVKGAKDNSTLFFLIFSVIGIVLILGWGLFTFLKNTSENRRTEEPLQTSIMTEDGKQIVNLTAKGGYAPRQQVAKADTPTILKVSTKNTFDCSAALSIPGIGYNKYLPGTGVTDVEIPAQKAGTTLKGSCSMGMYHFAITFS